MQSAPILGVKGRITVSTEISGLFDHLLFIHQFLNSLSSREMMILIDRWKDRNSDRKFSICSLIDRM